MLLPLSASGLERLPHGVFDFVKLGNGVVQKHHIQFLTGVGHSGKLIDVVSDAADFTDQVIEFDGRRRIDL